ncbi:hypothetical protein MMC15_008615 [Xylographa vitiligo]|nr:hypothetical protein [Xylographa vitiligo]
MDNVVPVTVNYEVSQPGEGQYEVKQVAEEQPVELNSGNRKEFAFDVKAFACVGYYDPDTKTIGVYPKIFGQQIGDGYSAGIDTGLGIQLVLAVYNGSLRFNKVGNELKAYLHLKPLLPWGDALNYEGTVLRL